MLSEISIIFVMQCAKFFLILCEEADEEGADEEEVLVFVEGVVEMGGNESWVFD